MKEKALIWLTSACAVILISGCISFGGSDTIEAPALPRNVSNPDATYPEDSEDDPNIIRVQSTPSPSSEQAADDEFIMPQMPARDDLTDPRMLAAAQSVGAIPSDSDAQVAPEPRNDLTDPRLLAAAKAAGITIPKQAPPTATEAETIPPVKATTEAPASTPVAVATEKPVVEPVASTAPKTAATTKPAATAPEVTERVKTVLPVEPTASAPAASTTPPKSKPVATTERSAPKAKTVEPVPVAAPPAKEYPISPPDARMIPFYEKQLDRDNLDPVIKAYYERKLEEARSAPVRN